MTERKYSPMDVRCTLCGCDEDSHYDGVQCPMFNGTYSATQKFTPPSNRCQSCSDLLRDGRHCNATACCPFNSEYSSDLQMSNSKIAAADETTKCQQAMSERFLPEKLRSESSAEPNLDLRCNSCDKPMVFHSRFATWVCRLFTRIEGIPATYARKPVFTRDFADVAISIGELPISGAELHDMKQGPCLSAYEEMTIEEARSRFPSPAEDVRFGERDPWVIPVYNPYVASSLMGYWPFLIPKRKPEVGYWPRSRSTSAPSTDFYVPRWRTSFESVRDAQENYAYHRHQQQMTDDFRAKLHFANRVLTVGTMTITDYHEWNAHVPEAWWPQ